MWRSVLYAVVNTGRELYGTRLAHPHRLDAPVIIARVLRHGIRPRLNIIGTQAFTTAPQLSAIRSSNGHRRCLLYVKQDSVSNYSNGNYSFKQFPAIIPSSYCTAVSVKPAVNAPEPEAEQKPVPREAAGSAGEDGSSVTEKTLPETDPWLLRHQIVTFNRDKHPERPKGLTFNAGYMDTGADWHDSKKAATPTVLAIPGQPGSHNDMLPVVRILHDHNPSHRVIVVNMPGYEFTKGLTAEDNEYFDNSSTDLSQFVSSFIKALQINRIDMMVTHSAGSIPLFIMVATSDLIQSAMIVCTPSLHVPCRVYRPLWFIKGLVNVWDKPIGRRFLKWFLPKFNYVIGWLDTEDPNQLITTAKFGAYSNFELMAKLSADIRAKKKPMVYVATKNDKLVELNLSLDWADMLGVEKTMFDLYDEHYDLVESGSMDNGETYPKGVLLTKGGHYPQRKEVALPVLRREVMALMAYVLREDKKPKN